MMIKIDDRICPYSHVPGTKIPIPMSTDIAQIFPAFVRFIQRSGETREISLDIEGPVKQFTAQLNLTKGWIEVWGQACNGFFRYWIYSSLDGPQISMEKISNQIALPVEKLSLGSHKSQDWSGVVKRGDLKEIMPAWFLLGQITPESEPAAFEGTLDLLQNPKTYDDFYRLWLAGFEGILAPRIEDTDYQGFKLPSVTQSSLSPWPLLSYGYQKIRQLFIQWRNKSLVLLPCLPKEFHCGRMTGIDIDEGSQISLEWTKKTLRRMEVSAQHSGELSVIFPKDLKSFRLKTGKTGKGEIFSCQKPLTLEKGKTYILDNFKK